MHVLILKTCAVGAAFVFFLLWRKQRNNYQREGNQSNDRPPTQENKEKCFICFNDFKFFHKDLLTTLPCNHKFHKGCINMVFTNMVKEKRTCPLCLKIVSEEFIGY